MAFRIAPQQEAPPPAKRSKSAKKPDYLDFIRQLPCCVTGQMTEIEAAHVSFANPWFGSYGRGKGTKVPDIYAVPLTASAHRAQHNANERQWWTKQGIDPHQLCLALFAIYSTHEEYDAIERATARIREGLMKRDLA